MSTIEQEAQVKVTVNGQEARNELQSLQTTAKGLKERIAEAYAAGDIKKVERLEKELRKVNSELRTMQKTSVNINDVMSRLNTATPKELKRTLTEINKELNSGKIQRGTEEWKKYNEQARRVSVELQKINAEKKVTESLMSKMTGYFNKYAAAGAAAIASLTGVVFTARKAVNAYAEMDEAQAKTRKYVGMTAEEVTDLNEEFKRMDTRTARTRLNELAGDAGRLGITIKEEILEFVNAADIINVALGEDLGEDAVKNIGKLAMMFGTDKEMGLRGAMLATGSAINELAQSSSAAEPYLLAFTARVAGAANQAKIAQTDIMGYASVLDQNMQQQEMSATAFQALMMKIFQDPAKFARLAGVEVKEFTRLVKEDANEAMLIFLESLNKRGGMAELAPMFNEMNLNGQRAVGVISTMAGKINDIRIAQNLANEAYREGTSVVEEFNIQNSTVQAEIDKRKKALNDYTVELGQKFLPLMKYALTSGKMMIKGLGTLTEFFFENKRAITSTSIALALYITYQKLAILVDKVKYIWNEKLIVSTRRLYQTIKAHPYGLILMAITLVIGKLKDLQAVQKKVTESEKVMNRIREQSEKGYAKETAQVKTLVEVVENENIANDKRLKALEKLKEIIPDYNGLLTEEGKLLNNNKDAIELYCQQLEKQIKLKAAQEELEELYANERTADKRLQKEEDELNKRKGYLAAAKFAAGQRASNAATSGTKNLATGLDQGIQTAQTEYNEAAKAVKKTKEELTGLRTAIKEVNEEIVNSDALTSLFSSEDNEDETPSSNGKIKERLKKIDEWLAIERTKVIAAYAKGEIDRLQHNRNLDALEIQSLEKKRELYDKSSGEYAKYTEQILNKQITAKEQEEKLDRENLKKQFENQKRELIRNYSEGTITFKAYKQGLLDEELSYLEKLKETYTEGSKERADIEAQIENKLLEDKLKKREKYEKELEKFQEEYKTKSLKELQDKELESLDTLLKEKLLKIEEYEKLKQGIELKYAGMEEYRPQAAINSSKEIKDAITLAKAKGKASLTPEDNNKIESGDLLFNLFGAEAKMRKSSLDALKEMEQNGLLSHSQYLQAKAELDADYFEGLAGKMQKAYATIDAVASSYINYTQANQELEIAKIEKKYEKEVDAAGNNSKKLREIERKKEKEISKVKSQYADKAFKIQIAQALAQTAISALNAYSSAAAVPLIGYILAPMAAIAATAAGMLNVATIKKQHEASKQGYWKGGFTPSGKWNEEQGVVHSDEFVANRFAVRNKNILPILNLIDQAQKNNTVGSLTAKDISNVLNMNIGTGGVDRVSIPEIVRDEELTLAFISYIKRSTEVINELNGNIERGIPAIVTIDGEDGFERKYKHYKKLENNKSR